MPHFKSFGKKAKDIIKLYIDFQGKKLGNKISDI